MTVQGHALLRRSSAMLRPVGWLVITGMCAATYTIGRHSVETSQLILLWSLGIFFPVLIVRLIATAIFTPRRRGALFVLAASVALWAAGSSAVNASKLSEQANFPAPGEWLFLASYVAMAGYLIIDARHRMSRSLVTWLDVAVVCGGTACLSASLLLLPVATASGKNGLPLLLALLYPLVDLALAVLVVAQVVLRLRPDAKHAAITCLGFMLLAFADGQFATSVSSATYDFGVNLDAIWGLGFAFIVGAACRPGRSTLMALPRRQGPTVMIFAGVAAILVMALRPAAGLGPYLVAPAALTLLAAGGRLILALREANGAAEALALSLTDDLTRLPNRRAVRNRLDEKLASEESLALLLLDMDGFKEINDTLGHAAGDTVLQLAAHRMRGALPPDVMIARLGGDEFAVVSTTEDEVALLETARVILDALAEPLLVDGIEIALSASIGIALHAESDPGSSELLRRADVAMYQAKLSRTGAALYDPHLDDFSRPRLQIAEELRRGIAAGELVLWYQPQIDAVTQEVCALEALIRWNHPTQGMLSPAVFLPVARRAGLMLMLSDEVARQAVAAAKQLRAKGLDHRIAINCAPPELLSGVFLPRLYDALASAGVPASALVVEVTEDSFLADPQRAREVLRDMREHDLQISVDDYGTGFSSLSYLRDLPVQELKIDRSFVGTMLADPRSRMIVVSTLQMAHGLGMRVVAEGVENAATAVDLIDMGVDILQGYHMAKPMPLLHVEPWIQQWTTFAASIGPWPLSDSANKERAAVSTRATRVQSARRSAR